MICSPRPGGAQTFTLPALEGEAWRVVIDTFESGGLPAPRTGEEYTFDLEIPGASVPVHGRFRVVGLPGADRAGVQFTALEQEDRMRIMSFAVEAAQDQRRSMR